MPAPSSLTLNYDAVLSSTLFNYRETMADAISTSNSLLYFLMKRETSGYVGLDEIGERMELPLMYALAPADSYSGYDTLDTTATDGITAAFYNWRQMTSPVTISGLEERKNTGQFQKFDLLKAKTEQAVMGIQDLFGRALLRGNSPNGGSAITSAYTSVANGSTFIDPIPLQVHYTPTGSTTIGNINQSTNTWWQNQKTQSGASTFAGLLKELSHMYNLCSKGPGGPPNLHITTLGAFETYEAALRVQMKYNTYDRADIPFGNILFRGNPITWDEFTPDAHTGTAAITVDTWYMLNTKFWKLKYDKERNFTSTPFVKPTNQDAKTAHILWLGALGVNNRRKQGVLGNISTSITS